MPTDLSAAFLDHNAETEKSKHRSTKFSGLYCLGSLESEVYRPKYKMTEPAVKVGKSINIIDRMNQYALYYPFSDPTFRIHCLLCMPYAVTREQKSNVDRAETFVLSTLKQRYPNHNQWPGVGNRFRLFFSRSEWMQGIPLKEVEDLFRTVACKTEFGPCMYVLNNGRVNIPKLWYQFRSQVQNDAQLKRDEKRAADEKNEALQKERADRKRRAEEIYASPAFKKRTR